MLVKTNACVVVHEPLAVRGLLDLQVLKSVAALQNRKANIMITCPCKEDSLTSHFYIVKLGFTGVFNFFLSFALKHRLWVLIRTASMNGSNVYQQSMF